MSQILNLEPLPVKSKRIVSIDILRGLVIVLMALDHVRDFFSNAAFDSQDLTKTNVALFFTRWITHPCAPTFVFLAGVGTYLSLKRGMTKRQLFYFLITRGIWLILLEVTVIRFGRTFDPDLNFQVAGVLWAIGWSMIILAPCIYFPIRTVGILGLLIIVSHNLLDFVEVKQLGGWGWLWAVLHDRELFRLGPDFRFFVQYPLIPWIGVMAIGYASGTIFDLPEARRKRILQSIGISSIASFFVLRSLNIYGDPHPWVYKNDWTYTLMSYFKCEKYPPSLLFLLITLGISIFILGCLEDTDTRYLKPLAILGRVPLFFYIVHIWSIHLAAVAFALPKYGWEAFTLPYMSRGLRIRGYGYELSVVYYIWMFLMLLLYPVCSWFDLYKKKNRNWLLNYL